jgi:hypothetical protein
MVKKIVYFSKADLASANLKKYNLSFKVISEFQIMGIKKSA